MQCRDYLVLILSVIMLAGCATRWVNKDGSVAPSARIEQARIDCRVEAIERELHEQEVTTEATVMITPNAAARQSLEERFETARRQARKLINDCMAREGLVPGD